MRSRLWRVVFILLAMVVILQGLYICLEDRIPKVGEAGLVFLPDGGYVPDSTTAVRIAEAIWLPLYGEGIYDAKPYVVSLKSDNVWVVEGCPGCHYWLDAFPRIEIRRTDGKILFVCY